MDLSKYMELALNEAVMSLREGNNGFGAVIIYDDTVVARAHDMEDTHQDATSHAEINAIKEASRKLGKNLGGCILVSTHEPCPMCATAIIWSGISALSYGYSIEDALLQGRKRINLPCEEIFERAGADIKIYPKTLQNRCSMLYNKSVRDEMERLGKANDRTLTSLNLSSAEKRVQWFKDNCDSFDFINEDILYSAYELLLKRLKIGSDEAPVVRKTDKEITFHSMNFCPTLEACKYLGWIPAIYVKSLTKTRPKL